MAWFAQFRRLAIRHERRHDIHLAFSTLAAALIVWRFIERWFCDVPPSLWSGVSASFPVL